MRAFAQAAVVLSVLLLASCGSSDKNLLTTAADSNPAARTAPASLPDLGSLPGTQLQSKRTQETGTYPFDEPDVVVQSGATFTSGVVHLNGGADTSYVVFGFNLLGGSAGPLRFSGSSTGMYVGYSDYAKGNWTWLGGPLTALSQIQLPAGGYASPGDMLYIALICPGGKVANCAVSIDFNNSINNNDGSWNFLVWIAGDNNLALDGYGDIQEMESVGSSTNVNVLCGYDIDPSYLSGQTGADMVRFIKVVQDSNPNSINTAGDPANQSFPRAGYNSADPAKLVEFVDWAATNFPAEHTALVLWNHGDGWITSGGSSAGVGGRGRNGRYFRSKGKGRGTSGVLGDETDSGTWSLTDNIAIVEALGSRHFDMLMFDACNMGQLEALYEYRNCADWLVGSECLVPGDGYPYDLALADWNATFPLAVQDIGAAFVDAMQSYYSSTGDFITLAVFNSGQINTLTSALHDLASYVTANAGTESDNVKSALSSAFEPSASDGERDLSMFLSGLRGLSSDTNLQALIDTASGDSGQAITHFAQVDQPDTNGLAIFLPSEWYFDDATKAAYASTSFDAATGWLAMLEAVGVPGAGGDIQVSTTWQPGDKVVMTWSSSFTDADLGTMDPDFYYSAPWFEPETANLVFSLDSYESGIAEEHAILKPTAMEGDYIISPEWYDFSGSGSVDVALKLYDSGGQLKEDLGVCTIPVNSYVDYAKLTYTAN